MKIFFITKKLIGTMVMPFQFSLLLIVLGIVLLWLNRRRRLAVGLVTGGAVLLLIFSNGFVGYHAVHHLETQYPPLRLEPPAEDTARIAQAQSVVRRTDAPRSALGPEALIVVLSGGASDDLNLPVTDRLTPDSALRVIAAVQIYRRLMSPTTQTLKPGQSANKEKQSPAVTPRIVILGGSTVNSTPEAIPMKTLAESLGIPANQILIETRSDDTASEAKDAMPLVGHRPFMLVTSAYHMLRAMALFQHLGMRPIAAPSNYMGRRTNEPLVLSVLPSTNALAESETAWHEQLGMIWEHVRGQL